jgi:iron complex transport system substrate-binding protein
MVALLALLFFFAAPGRIVSTAPAATEILYALGLGNKVVGVTQYCNYPPDAQKKPRIGTFLQPNLEIILGLRPGLVVIQKNPVHLSERLQGMGLKTVEVDQPDLAGLYDSIQRMGVAAGVPQQAKTLEAKIRADLEAIRKRTANLPPRRVMFIVGRNPNSIDGLVAVGSKSYLNELMALAGGKNIFGEGPAAYPKVGMEEILSRDPEVIIDMGDMATTTGVTDAQKRAVVALWNKYPMVSAVRQKRVFAVASDIFVVPGPRVVEAAREFARMLHPEAGF